MRQPPVTQQELDRLHAAWESAPESRSFAPLADAYHRAGRDEEAIELLHNGTARHPEYLSALVLLADCYQSLGRVEEADAVFARVLAQEGENLRALEHQAELSIRQGALGKAAALVERLRQIDPWDANIRRLAAQLQQGPRTQPPQAPAASPGPVAEPVPPRPSHPAPALPSEADERSADELSTLTLAQIYESQGYLQKALNIYERILAQHPDNALVAQRLEQLRRRLSGADDSARVEAPAAPEEEPQRSSTWRLLDAGSLEGLPPPRRETKPAAATTPPRSPRPAAAAAPGNEAASRDEDFQRFLRYVRSLGR